MMDKLRSALSGIKSSAAVSWLFQKTVPLDPGFFTKTSQIQLSYGIWVNMAQVAIGLGFGLTAVQVPQLSAPDSMIPITRNEASWIASVLTLFSPIGCLISGYIMDRFGRRVSLILCQAPMFVGWLYTALAKTADQIIIGRAITGMGCGMAMSPPRIFSTEISLPNMRGVIGAFPALAVSIGISIQAGLGQYFTWQTLCYICCAFTLINFFLNNFLPETPYYILKTKSPEEARNYLAKFRANNYDLEKEMIQLRDFKEDNDIRKLSIRENVAALFTKSSCKPFSLMIVYIFITQVSGVSCVLMWTIEILMAANSSYDAQSGNFLIALTRLVVGTITSMLLFRVGRKPLALISATGVSFTCFVIACYLTYNYEPSIVPQICFMLYMAFASLGYNTLPLLMASELYPLQVRGILSGITVSITSLLIFGSTKVYPLIMDNLGLIYTMVLFGVCSSLGSLFLYFFLPETKELTLQEIEEYYNELRPTLVSQRRILSMQQWEQQSVGSNKSKTSIEQGKLYRSPADLFSAGKSDAKQKIAYLLGRKSKDSTDSIKKSIDGTADTKKPSAKGKEALKIEDEGYLQKYAKELQKSKESMKSKQSAKSKESQTNKETETFKTKETAKSTESLKTKETATSTESLKTKETAKSTESLQTKETGKTLKNEETTKSSESLKNKETVKSTESLTDKEPKKESKEHATLTDKIDEEVVDLEEIKETNKNKETVKSDESKRGNKENLDKKEENEDDLKDDNQPSTSKKYTQDK